VVWLAGRVPGRPSLTVRLLHSCRSTGRTGGCRASTPGWTWSGSGIGAALSATLDMLRAACRRRPSESRTGELEEMGESPVDFPLCRARFREVCLETPTEELGRAC
jgi:ribosomal protein S14